MTGSSATLAGGPKPRTLKQRVSMNFYDQSPMTPMSPENLLMTLLFLPHLFTEHMTHQSLQNCGYLPPTRVRQQLTLPANESFALFAPSLRNMIGMMALPQRGMT